MPAQYLRRQLLRQALPDSHRLLLAQQGDDANRARLHFGIGDKVDDVLDDKFRFPAVNATVATRISDKIVEQRRIEPPRGGREPQRMQLVVVELALGVFDDRRDATEVLLEHYAAVREHHLGKVVNRTVRRHLRRIQGHLPVQVAFHQRVDAFLLDADRLRRHLLVVAHHEDFLRAQQHRQCGNIGLRSLVDHHQVEAAQLRRQGFRDAMMRHDPARHGALGFGSRGARIASITESALAGAFANALDGVEVGLQCGAYAGRGNFGELEPAALDDQFLVHPRKVMLDFRTCRGKLFQLVVCIDRLEMGRKPAQPPVAQQGHGGKFFVETRRHLPQLLGQLRCTGTFDVCRNPGDHAERNRKGAQPRKLRIQFIPGLQQRRFIHSRVAQHAGQEFAHAIDDLAAFAFQRTMQAVHHGRDLAELGLGQVKDEGELDFRQHRGILVGVGSARPRRKKLHRHARQHSFFPHQLLQPGVVGELRFRRQPAFCIGGEDSLQADFRHERIPSCSQRAFCFLQFEMGKDDLPVRYFAWTRSVDAHHIQEFFRFRPAEHSQPECAPSRGEVAHGLDELRVGLRHLGHNDRPGQGLHALRAGPLHVVGERFQQFEQPRRHAAAQPRNGFLAPGQAPGAEFLAQCFDARNLLHEPARFYDGLGTGSRRDRQFAGARLAHDLRIPLQVIVSPDQQQGIGQIAQLRKRVPGINDVFAKLPACFPQAHDVLRGKARNILGADAEAIREPFELPGVAHHFRGGVLRIDGLAAQIDARNIQFRPTSQIGIDAFEFAMQGVDGLDEAVHLAARGRRIQALHFGGNLADRALELVGAVLFGGQQRQRERLDIQRQLFAQHSERRVAHRGHQYAAAVGKPVADDVGDGVRLTRARRPLHDHAVGNFQHLHDARLFVVERLGEEQVLRFHRLGHTARMVGGAHPAEGRQGDRHRDVGGLGDQCRHGPGKLTVLVERRQQLAIALQVLNCDDGAARPCKHDPAVADFDVVRAIVLSCRLAGLDLKLAPGNGQQRFEPGGLERGQRFACVGQELPGLPFRRGQGSRVALQEKVQFKSRIDIAGPQLRGLGLRVEPQFHGAGDQGINNFRPGQRRFAQTHSPYEFELAFYQRTGKLLLQGKQAYIETGAALAIFFRFRPGLPGRLEITGVLRFDFSAKRIIRKRYPGIRIDGGSGRRQNVRRRLGGIAMRAGRNEGLAVDLRCEPGHRAFRRTNVQPGSEPGIFSLGGNFGCRRMRQRQPDLVIAIRAAVVKPQPFDTMRMVVEQQQASMVRDIRFRPAARAHRLLCVVDERHKAPLLEVHGR